MTQHHGIPPSPSAIKLTDVSIGGVYKRCCEDFRVIERPLYEPSGTGAHLYLTVTKRDLSHIEMTKRLARHLGVDRHAIKAAGMKDRRAVTTQAVTVESERTAHVGDVDDLLRIDAVSRHGNGLKLGHLASNLFEIIVRDCDCNAASRIDEIIRLLSNRFANSFGHQRFGRGQSTLSHGLDLVRDSYDRRRRPTGSVARLSLAAVQSYLFNKTLVQRRDVGLWNTVIAGDVLGFPGRGGVFLAEDVASEQRRLSSGETCLTGPMVGARCKRPTGPAGELEDAILEGDDLTFDQFRPWKRLIRGERRPFIVCPDWNAVERVDEASEHAEAVRLRFTLPPGSYATSILTELGCAEGDQRESTLGC